MSSGDILRSVHPHGEEGAAQDAVFNSMNHNGDVTSMTGLSELGGLLRDLFSSRRGRHAEQQGETTQPFVTPSESQEL